MGVDWASAVCKAIKKREKEVEKWKRTMGKIRMSKGRTEEDKHTHTHTTITTRLMKRQHTGYTHTRWTL